MGIKAGLVAPPAKRIGYIDSLKDLSDEMKRKEQYRRELAERMSKGMVWAPTVDLDAVSFVEMKIECPFLLALCLTHFSFLLPPLLPLL